MSMTTGVGMYTMPYWGRGLLCDLILQKLYLTINSSGETKIYAHFVQPMQRAKSTEGEAQDIASRIYLNTNANS